MHEFVAPDREAMADVADWIVARLDGHSGVPRPRSRPADVSLPHLTSTGIGTPASWSVLRDVVLPTAFPTDHPRYLAFVGGAPTPASVLADAALSAASVYGGSELEAGAVATAESDTIRWLCEMVGYGTQAHGAFVSGGSAANLSALVAARHGRTTEEGRRPEVIVAGASVHASVRAAAEIMGCRVVLAGSTDGALTAARLGEVLAGLEPRNVVAVVASAGATNTGTVDALEEVADVCARFGAWLHVDAAYGGAALLAPTHRWLFAGIERADSVTIDPHKWLFTPIDCAAVLYREPARARAAHRQEAHYLDAVNDESSHNPSDYTVQLTRRARGLPLWASLVAYGTDAYVDAVELCLATADYAAKQIEASPAFDLVHGPHLSVVLFRCRGWTLRDYQDWSEQARLSGLALITPTRYANEAVLRFCVVNPSTTTADIDLVLRSLREFTR